jgi:hypothetical protein
MNLATRAAGVASSRHARRATKVVKILNVVGTVRGAVTTVLLAVSAVGGAATVNTVRQDIAHDRVEPRATQVARSAAPTASPLTAAGLRADMQKRLDTALAANGQAVEDLRRVAVFSGPRLDQLVADTKQRLQARYELGTSQLAALIEGPASPPPSTPTPSASTSSAPTTAPASPSVIAAYALLQVITGDMNQIVVQATRAATQPTAIPRPATPTPPPATAAPTPTPRPTPTHTASPSPTTTARTPTPRPSATPSPTR